MGANIADFLPQLLHLLLLDNKVLPLEHLHLRLILSVLQHGEYLAHLLVYGILRLDKLTRLAILLSHSIRGTGTGRKHYLSIAVGICRDIRPLYSGCLLIVDWCFDSYTRGIF